MPLLWSTIQAYSHSKQGERDLNILLLLWPPTGDDARFYDTMRDSYFESYIHTVHGGILCEVFPLFFCWLVLLTTQRFSGWGILLMLQFKVEEGIKLTHVFQGDTIATVYAWQKAYIEGRTTNITKSFIKGFFFYISLFSHKINAQLASTESRVAIKNNRIDGSKFEKSLY